MQAKIDAYFALCCNPDGSLKMSDAGYPIRPISITGLALYLDTSRETLCNYEDRDEFFDAVKRAKLRVENFYEERLTFNNPTGSIFALKNFDWSDKSQTEVSGGMAITRIERVIVDPKP